jgi:hypothetical protein
MVVPALELSAMFRPDNQEAPPFDEYARALFVKPPPLAAISSPVVGDVIQFKIPIRSKAVKSNTVAPSPIHVAPSSTDFDIDCGSELSRPRLYHTLPPVQATLRHNDAYPPLMARWVPLAAIHDRPSSSLNAIM